MEVPSTAYPGIWGIQNKAKIKKIQVKKITYENNAIEKT